MVLFAVAYPSLADSKLEQVCHYEKKIRQHALDLGDIAKTVRVETFRGLANNQGAIVMAIKLRDDLRGVKELLEGLD